MALRGLVERNVRPKHQDEDDVNVYEVEEDVFEEFDEDLVSEPDADGDEPSEDESLSEDTDNSNEDEDGIENEDGDVNDQVANVSFGALLQAQDAISRKRKRGSNTTAEQDAKLEVVRARLREIRTEKSRSKSTSQLDAGTGDHSHLKSRHQGSDGKTHNRKVATNVEEDSNSDSDSAPSEEESAPTKSRTSKHAPATQSSKHQVTRKRTVVDVPKKVVRDPRFDALHQSSVHPGNSDKAYSFLRDYQKAEIQELKTAVKAARNEDDKETLKRKLVSMENRLKSKEAQEREQEILRKHRREEREKVELTGKKPFFLKKKDVKERAMAERFQGMKKKDQQKLIDRRKKREGEKEMRRMPQARRIDG